MDLLICIFDERVVMFSKAREATLLSVSYQTQCNIISEDAVTPNSFQSFHLSPSLSFIMNTPQRARQCI